MKTCFDHERLHVYQASIQFIALIGPLLEKLPCRLSAADQLDRASTAIPLNIAEGNGRYTAPDRCRFFDTARGSAIECAACLDVLVAKSKLTPEETEPGKAFLLQIVSMLVGLIRANDTSRVHEDSADLPYVSPVTD